LRELLGAHGLGEQEALRQIETQLPHGEKICPGLDALGDSARAIAIGEVKDAAADRLLQPVLRAAGDEFPINLDLNEGKVAKPGEREPLGPEIVDRNSDLVRAKLLGDFLGHVQVANDFGAIDFDDGAFESGTIGVAACTGG
jgi:hypothetical protein